MESILITAGRSVGGDDGGEGTGGGDEEGFEREGEVAEEGVAVMKEVGGSKTSRDS